MNEITRIHIAKTAYDIEVAAKKQLEKYIKSLETYTQDREVLEDIEIRMTELLAERGVTPGGVISSEDVSAVRAQLGEPYEFAEGEGDIAVGTTPETTSRRLYRSTDNAVLGGVLSGIAAYIHVNPLWVRLAFIVLLFISFGFALLVYIVLWILIPPARTATEKLQLVGKDVTLESIKSLNADEEGASPNRVAPLLQRVLSVVLGVAALLGAVGTFIFTVSMVIAALTFNARFMDITNGFMGLGDGNAWVAWLVFGIVIFGLLLLTALLGLIAYAFFAKKLTKRMLVSGIIIMVLGISSVAATLGISASQSFRVASETRSMVRETKANLPKEFATVTTVSFVTEASEDHANQPHFFGSYSAIRYVVDEGPARYELSALPTTKPVITIEGTKATISLTVPESFRNSFVQPMLIVYGPALQTIESGSMQVDYFGTTQDSLSITSKEQASLTVSGSYRTVDVKGRGSVDVGSSTIQSLIVRSERGLSVNAGTIRDLDVTQPDVCPAGEYSGDTLVSVAAVTSGSVTYNGTSKEAHSLENSCATLRIEADETYKNW